MFTSILGIGIANILMTFAGHIGAAGALAGRGFNATWLLILLLTHLGMFWNSTLIVQREEWRYGLFLFLILGPILLLFAASLMTSLLAVDSTDPEIGKSERALARFLFFYAAVQAWFIGADYVVSDGWTAATTVSALLCLGAVALAFVNNRQVLWTFTVAILGLSLADIALN